MPSRRSLLSAGLAAVLGTAGCADSQDPGTAGTPTRSPDPTPTASTPTPDLPHSVALEPITERPDTPLGFAAADGGASYVLDRPGTLYRLEDDQVETALDLTDAVMTGGERGLLGMALHHAFEETRRLYLRYSAPARSGTPETYSHTFVLAEFRVEDDGTVDPASERTLLEIPQPQGNHNSGSVAFGPEGYLYVGVGDGGAGGDRGAGHVEDWYDANPGGNGQDVTENLLGSLLRIDVTERSGERPYGIPSDNPLVGTEGFDEQYAWGLRNPWGISFDGGDCYLADVGQNRYEEVNRIERGGNYGWNVREGRRCYRTDPCPDTTPSGEPLRDPVIAYPHGGSGVSGVAVVGGHVYRGGAIPGLAGRYVFGDLAANGRLFVATPRASGQWKTEVLPVAPEDSDRLDQLLGLARDRTGELYALTPGAVLRIVPSG